VSPHLSNGTSSFPLLFSFPASSLHDDSSPLKLAAHHGVVLTLSSQVYTFTGQNSPFPVLFTFLHLSVLTSGPHQWATLFIEHHRAWTSSSLTHFYSLPTYSDPCQTRSWRPFRERVQFNNSTLRFPFSFRNFCFSPILHLRRVSRISHTFSTD
jgi:hypothetical protein